MNNYKRCIVIILLCFVSLLNGADKRTIKNINKWDRINAKIAQMSQKQLKAWAVKNADMLIENQNWLTKENYQRLLKTHYYISVKIKWKKD